MKFPTGTPKEVIEGCTKVSAENVRKLKEKLKFPDIRSCEIWIEFADGSTLTTDDFLDMDKCIETQIRDTFEIRPRFHDPATKSGSAIVNFKWKELGI